MIIHPVLETLVANKVSRGDHLVNNGKLFCSTSLFCIQVQTRAIPNYLIGRVYHKDALRPMCWLVAIHPTTNQRLWREPSFEIQANMEKTAPKLLSIYFDRSQALL